MGGLLLEHFSGFRYRHPNTLIARAMNTGSLFNSTFGIDQLCFAFWEETGYLFQDGIQELIFGYGLDDFAFAEDYAASLATGKAYICIPRFPRPIDHPTHHSPLNPRPSFHTS